MTEKYQAPTVKKAFQILKLLAEADNGLGISALAKSLGLSKSTVHGITAAMEDMDVIIRNPLNKRYTLGYTVVELGTKGLARIPLRDAARRYLEMLVEETGESVFLGILKDNHILILDVAESNRELKISAPRGAKIPLNAGATGKLFLAHIGEKNAVRFLSETQLVKYTENSIIDLDDYLQELKRVREQGYATDYREYLQGVNAVAALIRSSTAPLAAIWVVGFASSLTEQKMPKIIERTIRAAEAIGRELNERLSH